MDVKIKYPPRYVLNVIIQISKIILLTTGLSLLMALDIKL
jgi:hypothetical protein